MKSTALGNFRYMRQRMGELWAEALSGKDYSERLGGRAWEDHYRRRCQYDTVVHRARCTHCSTACPLDIYVNNGLVAHSLPCNECPQEPRPAAEPGGCAPGLAAAWYVHSPARLRYPLLRATLLHLWQAALRAHPDPVEAWASIMDNPVKRTAYQQARGKGGMVRVSWEAATELAAAALVHVVRRHGPDRIFGQTSSSASSPLSFAAGARFLNLLGGVLLSSHDWNGGLNPAAAQVFGPNAPQSPAVHWEKAGHIILWGCNAPQTRTAEAHFLTAARCQGTRVTTVSPDYSLAAKLSDDWLAVRPGSDGALALAMTHVILKEYFLQRPTPYFVEYAKAHTDLPDLVLLERKDGRWWPGRLARAADLGQKGQQALWKRLVFDQHSQMPLCKTEGTEAPQGAKTQAISPLLSLHSHPGARWEWLTFPDFSESTPHNRLGAVPCLPLYMPDGAAESAEPLLVTTVFDVLAASLSLDRGHGGHTARGLDDSSAYATPAWQEAFTGILAQDVVRVARDFADTALATGGRSLILTGAGVNHWYHNDSTGRCILSLSTLCGCHAVQGGGWAHMAGQSPLPAHSPWMKLGLAADWHSAPRLHNATSFYYFALDAWRYEELSTHAFCPEGISPPLPAHPADCNALAARLGWLPSYPQFRENPLETCTQAEENGARKDAEMVQHMLKRLRGGDLPLAVDEPAHWDNVPRVLLVWRANPLGAGVKGHEYFLRHMLGTEHAVRAVESADQPLEFQHGPAEEQGKLDLLLVSDIRCSTTCLYADVILPAAHDYEMPNPSLATETLTPPAADPPWEARDPWEMFRLLSAQFSRLAVSHLGTRKDVVSSPLLSGTQDILAQPLGQVQDWRKGDVEPLPGETLFHLHVLERRYAQVLDMYTSFGPQWEQAGPAEEDRGQKALPLGTALQVCQALLRLSADAPATGTPSALPHQNSGQHFYLDHLWMRGLGESLPVFRPPLCWAAPCPAGKAEEGTEEPLWLRLLTPHSKLGINSTLADTLILRHLTRGSGAVWLNDQDAARAHIADNMWLECVNSHGVFMGRAVLSHRIPAGTTLILHAQERHMDTPFSPSSGQRGGTHNSLTRPLLKPTQMIGGYGQFAYAFHHYGPTGSQRDFCVLVRKAGEENFYED